MLKTQQNEMEREKRKSQHASIKKNEKNKKIRIQNRSQKLK